MNHEEISRIIKEIVESKEPLKLEDCTRSDRLAISKWIAELTAECFIKGYNEGIRR